MLTFLSRSSPVLVVISSMSVNADFRNSSVDAPGLKRPAQVSIKKGH